MVFVNIVQEYKRLETLRQIKEADRRTEEMTARKEEMINQRRRAALEAKMQKEEITRIMENTKRNQKKAARLIQKV
ncbi:unnamed protein product, partial [Hapterophycus canaliculatus]